MSNFRLEVMVRIVADTAILCFAILTGFVTDYTLAISAGVVDVQQTSFFHYVSRYAPAFVLLLVVGICTFATLGFYTRGRAYSGRYKALIVLQAVALAFLISGFFTYLMFPAAAFPRKTILVAWAVATVFILLARVWAFIWRLVLSREQNGQLPISRDGKTRNVLLIGGAGYIGSALLPKLLDQGYRVRILDMFIYGEDPIRQHVGHPNLEILRADFRQIDKVVEAMSGMDAVIHIGAIVGDPACAIDEDLTIEVNLIATKMIAEVAKGQGISKFIFASTCSVYGASDQILNENSALNPVSLYARSKIASERVLVKMRSPGFRPVILRFGTIYGLSGRTRFDLVVNLLTAKALIERKITVFGSDQWRPFIHVEDAGGAIIRALQAAPELLHDVIFNVGSDEQNRTLGQVGSLIKSMVPRADLIVSDADSDRRNYRVDFARIRHVLDFRPSWTLEDGIKQVIEAVASGRVKDYRDAKYSNVKYLTEEAGVDMLRMTNGLELELPERSPALSRGA